MRQGWALRIPGREGVPQLGKGLPADSLSPGWHQEAFVGGQAQVLSPHGHHRGALLGEKSRRIKWRLPSPHSCPGVLSRPWQGGPGSTRPGSSPVPKGRRLCHPLRRAPLASCHSHMSTFCLQPLLLPCPWTITWGEVTQIFLVPPAPLTLAPRHQACVGQGRGLQSSLISPCDAKARTWREGCPGCRPPCCLHHDGSCPPAIRDHTCLPSIHTCTSGPSVARHSYCWPTGIPAGAHTCARHSADPCSPHTVPKGRPPPLL